MSKLKEIAEAVANRVTGYRLDDQDLLEIARVALETMREPTEEMCRAKVRNTYDDEGEAMDQRGALDNTCAKWVWQAMIDAAIK